MKPLTSPQIGTGEQGEFDLLTLPGLQDNPDIAEKWRQMGKFFECFLPDRPRGQMMARHRVWTEMLFDAALLPVMNQASYAAKEMMKNWGGVQVGHTRARNEMMKLVQENTDAFWRCFSFLTSKGCTPDELSK